MDASQAASQHADGRPAADPLAFCGGYHDGLEIESHTSQKLRHSTAYHLHVTNRRYFIGPIPKGWLQIHRKSWYKTRLKFKDYSSRTITFSADPVAEHYGKNRQYEDEALPSPPESISSLGFTEHEGVNKSRSSGRRQQRKAVKHKVLKTILYPLTEAEDAPELSDLENAQHQEAGQVNVDYTSVDTEQGPSPGKCLSASAGQSAAARPIHAHQIKSQGQRNADTFNVCSSDWRGATASISETESTQALVVHEEPQVEASDSPEQRRTQNADSDESSGEERRRRVDQALPLPVSSKMAKYNIGDNILDKRQRARARISRAHEGISAARPHRRKIQEGEIVKAERMLVQVEETTRGDLPDNYSECDSLGMETRITDRWREFLVVCRKTGDEQAPFTLQMYKTRVIPEVQKPGTRAKPYHEIRLSRKRTRVNLYSPLDKTLVIWFPCKHGTSIYIIRPKSAAHAVEWHTFVLEVLGWSRPSSLSITVPDIGASLIFRNPFTRLSSLEIYGNSQGDGGLDLTMADEDFAAATIIRGCLEMLEGQPELADVLKVWSKTDRMGLAWKRYDRLEWISGANEKNMYGTIAMSTSHELELRPRHHYPTTLRRKDSKEEEPRPVEGFLVRLTSQRGIHRRMNMMFFKRLYFFTQDRYLLFTRPPKSMPPSPPKMIIAGSSVPSPQEILDKMPLSYDIDPYPLRDDEVAWLPSGNKEFVKLQDEEAYAHAQRNIHNLIQADGYIDLCRVREVREMLRSSSPADSSMRRGSGTEFGRDAGAARRDDGTTRQFNDDRTFEVLLDNGLVVRLQAYNKVTRDEWIERLRALVGYWTGRCAADTAELKAIRQRNLDLLKIDERTESLTGQFAQKWEVRKAEASPHLHNMCNLMGCRTIKMSGYLYLKPRRHSTFKRCNVILTAGKLLIFRSSMREHTGVEIPHVHQELETSLDLENCYIYSGLLTDSDLLYENQTFDSDRPGLHALPRIYLSSDVYTSCDEDTAISFVLWQPLQKDIFRTSEAGERGQTRQTLRQVSKLGVHGRTTVFRARSRVEKDRWVLSISSEIDRLQEGRREDIRIVRP